jgi:hypothetical protein
LKIRDDNNGDQICILCTDCGTPIAQIVGDCLVVKVKHHGTTHVSVLPVAGLLQLTVVDDLREKIKSLV